MIAPTVLMDMFPTQIFRNRNLLFSYFLLPETCFFFNHETQIFKKNFHILNTHWINYSGDCTHLNQHRKCFQQRCHLFQLQGLVVVCAVLDFILKLLHINSSIIWKLPCEFIFRFTKLPISQFFDEFSNAAKWFFHMKVTVSFLVSPPTVDGSHVFMCFLMFCQNFLGGLFHKASSMHQLCIFVGTSYKLLMLFESFFTFFYNVK